MLFFRLTPPSVQVGRKQPFCVCVCAPNRSRAAKSVARYRRVPVCAATYTSSGRLQKRSRLVVALLRRATVAGGYSAWWRGEQHDDLLQSALVIRHEAPHVARDRYRNIPLNATGVVWTNRIDVYPPFQTRRIKDFESRRANRRDGSNTRVFIHSFFFNALFFSC